MLWLQKWGYDMRRRYSALSTRLVILKIERPISQCVLRKSVEGRTGNIRQRDLLSPSLCPKADSIFLFLNYSKRLTGKEKKWNRTNKYCEEQGSQLILQKTRKFQEGLWKKFEVIKIRYSRVNKTCLDKRAELIPTTAHTIRKDGFS